VAATVRLRDGLVAAVERATAPPRAAEDVGELWLLPGLVDPHVHVNEPGRTEWEGFETACRAAAAGGVCTILDMPLNAIPAATTGEALAAKEDLVRWPLVHVRFWGGLVPGNTRQLRSLAANGARGFKCFLVPSGVPEFGHVGESDLRDAMPELQRIGLPLLVHAESPGPIDAAAEVVRGRDPRSHGTWLDSRPPEAEVEAIRMVLRLGEEFDVPVHIVHLSAADALADLRAARARGVRVTVETCPHYLTFVSREIEDGATSFKCAPPIRTSANRDALWEALREGVIDMIASDHSPCPPDMKRPTTGNFFDAWGGIASLELGLAAVWTEASRRGFALTDVVRWMARETARLSGFSSVKGTIEPGRDADLVAFDPDGTWTVEPARLHQRHKLTPYAGRTLRGIVRRTWVDGAVAWDRELGFSPPAPHAAGPLARVRLR
jgi:allantoinase